MRRKYLGTVYVAGDINAEPVERNEEEHEEDCCRLAGFVGISRIRVICIQRCD